MENENLEHIENIENLQEQSMEVTKKGQRSLLTIGNWMLFFGILLAIAIVFIVVAAIMMFVTSKIGTSPMPEGMINVMVLVYLIIGVIMIFPTYYLFNSSSKLKKAIETQSSKHLEDALSAIKNYWRTYGIVTIISIALAFAMAIIMSITVATKMGHGMYNM